MKVNVSTGGPFFLLFLVFMVLKLTNVIAWSWWYVTMPLWIFPAIGLTLWAAGIVAVVIYELLNRK